ncbi:hypothetical protein LBMAG42_13320 [Deltaproteobacteria bacterium]|nr:hypothetical protein LBMAG42_13320 [Deltaproteobacteria bacterium]
MNDDAFDAQFTELGPVEPKPELSAHTLRAWRRERQAGAWRTRGIAVAGMLAMAALALLVVDAPEPQGTTETMVERGTGPAAPNVVLKVVVRGPAGEVSRFATNQRYAAGNTLMFRVSTPIAAPLALRRNGALVWSGSVAAGETDLPLGYTLEAGEDAAHFTIEGGAEALDVYVPAVAP